MNIDIHHTFLHIHKYTIQQVYKSTIQMFTEHITIMTYVKIWNAPKHDFYMHVVPNHCQGRHLNITSWYKLVS